MSIEENKALVRRLLEDVATKGDHTVLDRLVAPDVVLHGTTGQELLGREAYKQYNHNSESVSRFPRHHRGHDR